MGGLVGWGLGVKHHQTLLLNPPLRHGYPWSTKGHSLQGTAKSIDARTEALEDNFECWKFEIYLLSLWKYGVGKILISAISYRWLVVVYANVVTYWISRNSSKADTAFCKVMRMTYSNFWMSSGWPYMYVNRMRYHQELSHLDDTCITKYKYIRYHRGGISSWWVTANSFCHIHKSLGWNGRRMYFEFSQFTMARNTSLCCYTNCESNKSSGSSSSRRRTKWGPALHINS